MRYLVFILLLILSFPGLTQSTNLDTLTFEGINYEKKLYFVNPSIPDQGYSMQEVKINGKEVYDELRSNTVTIHPGRSNVDYKDSMQIRVFYVKDYKPKLLNPENLLPPDNFKFTYIRIRDGKLIWRTEGAQGQKPFIVEQYRWNRWIKATEIPVSDSIRHGSYEYEITPHHGKNRYRIVKLNTHNEKVISRKARVSEYSIPKVKIIYNDVKDMLVLSSKTLYEIYDEDWTLIREGYGRYVDVSGMAPGKYNINFGNRSGIFKVK